MEQIFQNEYNVKISRKKGKVIVYAINNNKVINITLGGEKLEQVQEFCYLGSTITGNGRNTRERVKNDLLS